MRLAACWRCAASVAAVVIAAGLCAAARAAPPTERAVELLTRRALLDLRGAPLPVDAEYRRAAVVFGLARELAPADAALLRSEIDAWGAAGDREKQNELSRSLLRLDPRDEVAQLRLALDAVHRLDDADARLSAYDRLLGPRGSERFSPAVRSRLALDGALLARETGDDRRALDLLTLATTLDVTHKEAAALFAAELLPLTRDPVERADLLLNVVLADPLDAAAYENLALEYARFGAWRAASMTYAQRRAVLAERGVPPPTSLTHDALLALWHIEGAQALLDDLARRSAERKAQSDARRQGMEDEGLDPGPEPPAYLELDIQLLRLLAAVSAGEPELAESVLLGVAGTVLEQSAEVAGRARELRDERVSFEAFMKLRELQSKLLFAVLFEGSRPELAQQALAEVQRAAEEAGEEPPDLPLFRGWLAAIEGDSDEARRSLSRAPTSRPATRWALATLAERAGGRDAALRLYAKLIAETPESPLAAAAAERLRSIRGRDIAPTADARRLDEHAAQAAKALGPLFAGPRARVAIRAEHTPVSAGPIESFELTIGVRNVSSRPLAVGTGQAIGSRLLVSPRLRLAGVDAAEALRPEVAQVQTRLRLEPAEEVVVRLRPRRGWIGDLLDSNLGRNASLRWQVVQDFVVDPATGGYRPGVGSVTTLSDILARASVSASDEPEAIAALVRTASGDDLALAAAHASSRVLSLAQLLPPGDPQRDAGVSVLTEALAGRLGTLDRAGAVVVLFALSDTPAMSEPAQREELQRTVLAMSDPVVTAAWVLVAVRDADDPLLDDLLAVTDDRLSVLATGHRVMLRRMEAVNAAAPGPGGG